ncbi:hypothetical protein AwErysi_06590 [Erysipelotrichaceae bacterium]|nr:hypothetical protein AwErysi_06590 [Erysipelotrichaceae bacterium]
MQIFWKIKVALLRNKSYRLLLVIVVILSQVIFLSLLIQQTNSSAIANIKNKVGAKVEIQLDYTQFAEEGFRPLTTHNLKVIGNLPQVKAYDYSESGRLFSDEVQQVQMAENRGLNEGINEFRVKGINYGPLLEIELGEITLFKGRTFSASEIEDGATHIMISRKLFEKNGYALGEDIVLDWRIETENSGEKVALNPNAERAFTTIEKIPFRIIGVFEKPNRQNPNPGKETEDDEYEKRLDDANQNEIYISNKIVHKLNQGIPSENDEAFGNDAVGGEITYILNTPDDLEQFLTMGRELLHKDYQFVSGNNLVRQLKASLKTSEELAELLLRFSIISSGVVLVLFLHWMFGERKHKYGIYIALGQKRSAIFFQNFIEITLVIMLAVSTSFFLAQVSIPLVAEKIIISELAKTKVNPIGYEADISGFAIDAEITGVGVIDYRMGMKILLLMEFILLVCSLLLHIKIAKLQVRELLLEG